MSRRKDMSPQRRLSISKTAQSQPGISEDYHTIMASNRNNNEHSSIRRQNMHMPLEESVERREGGPTEPESQLAVENKSIKRTHMITLTEVGSTALDNASHIAKEDDTQAHCTHRSDLIIRNTKTNNLSPVEFGTQNYQGNTSPESVDIRIKRNHTSSNDISPESEEFDAQRKHATRPGPISPDSEEFGAKRKHATRPGTISPESEEFGAERKYATRPGPISPESEVFGAKAKHATRPGPISPESEEFGAKRKYATRPGPISPESEEFDAKRKYATRPGPISPESEEFGAKRKHATRSGHIGPESEEFGTHREHTTNSNNFNPLASASTGVSLKVAEENDDSSAHKTDEQQKTVGKECSSSNSVDDDQESRDFFICKICLDRIQRWLLIPCGHLLCLACKQKMSICPFCRTPIQECKKIRYSFDD